MKHIWSILCKKTVIDTDTNNLSIFDVLEEATFTPFDKEWNKEKDKPIMVPFDFELVSLWLIEKEKKLEMLIEVCNPKGKRVKVFEKIIPFPQGKTRMRTLIKIRKFKFRGPGNYLFSVKVKDGQRYKLVAEIPLEIKVKLPSK